MNSAASREQFIDRPELVDVIVNGEPQTMTYRAAVGLISLGRAKWAEKPKSVAKKAAKK